MSESRKAILLVAHGSRVQETQNEYTLIEQAVRIQFPDFEVRWAFSGTRRPEIGKNTNNFGSPLSVLTDLLDEGYNSVAVQPFHFIAGSEYHDLVQIVAALKEIKGNRKILGFQKLILGRPLLDQITDYQLLLKGLADEYAILAEKEAVILMGHGTKHPAFAAYGCLYAMLQNYSPHVFLAVLEGFPKLDDIIVKLKQNEYKKVHLKPFLAVAGIHVLHDLAGEHEYSWANVLKAHGFDVSIDKQGMARHPALLTIFLDHLQQVVEKITPLHQNRSLS